MFFYIWWLVFFIQDTYNIRFLERCMDYLSTHLEFDPNLWLEVGSNARLDRNWVYDISNTTFENIQVDIVSWSFGTRNPNRPINHWSFMWSYKNTFKLRWPNLGLKRPNWGIKWMSLSIYWQLSLVHALHLVTVLVLLKICLCLLH